MMYLIWEKYLFKHLDCLVVLRYLLIRDSLEVNRSTVDTLAMQKYALGFLVSARVS